CRPQADGTLTDEDVMGSLRALPPELRAAYYPCPSCARPTHTGGSSWLRLATPSNGPTPASAAAPGCGDASPPCSCSSPSSRRGRPQQERLFRGVEISRPAMSPRVRPCLPSAPAACPKACVSIPAQASSQARLAQAPPATAP